MQLPASASIAHITELLPLLEQAVAEAGTGELTVDASSVSAFDSSTLALLLEAGRRVQAAGGRLVVRGMPPQMLELARLYGVDGVLPTAPA